LTRLSAWWMKLGIGVEFITPGRPCENGAHEQLHRIYKAEVAANPEGTRAAQQQRGARWLAYYNGQRPHEALGMKVERILLDNMTTAMMREAVELNAGVAKLEASGNVTLASVREIAETGVDYISIGALTHSPETFDVSLKWLRD